MSIQVIALVDTEASASIFDPKFFLDEFWESHIRYLGFSTKVRSKPTHIQFFPKCSIYTRIISSSYPNIDLIIGRDILNQLPALQILLNDHVSKISSKSLSISKGYIHCS